jgi:gamma-glutamyltranspeptidase/glutathione hydrolase
VRGKISEYTTLPIDAYNPNNLAILPTYGTSHLSAADASGLTVSLAGTINLWFGSRLVVPETGLIMNNEMNDFSIPGTNNSFGYLPSPANYIRPGKRPLSSMAPTVVEFWSNRTLYCSFGASGGSYIITAVLQSLWNVLDRKMNLFEALQAPRFHDQLVPDIIEFEYDYRNETASFLRGLGHKVSWGPRGSVVNAIRRLPNGIFEAVSEPSLRFGGGFAT